VDEYQTRVALEDIGETIDRPGCIGVIVTSERDVDILHTEAIDNSGLVKGDLFAVVHFSDGSEVDNHGDPHLLKTAERRLIGLAADQNSPVTPQSADFTTEPFELARQVITFDSDIDDGFSRGVLS